MILTLLALIHACRFLAPELLPSLAALRVADLDTWFILALSWRVSCKLIKATTRQVKSIHVGTLA